MKRELQQAAKVQRSLLPRESISANGASFAWRFVPSSELGGDMFDVVQLDESHFAVYLLDVVGHGACPALLAVTVSQILSHMQSGSLLFESNGDPTARPLCLEPIKVAEHLNERFQMSSECNQFFTFIYGVLNLEKAEFRYVGAGQGGPVLVRKDEGAEVFPSTGMAIGWFPSVAFEDYTIRLQAGDRLYLYSDGVVETENADDEQFCARRLARVTELSRTSELDSSIDMILRSLSRWRGKQAQADDVSLLGIEFEGCS